MNIKIKITSMILLMNMYFSAIFGDIMISVYTSFMKGDYNIFLYEYIIEKLKILKSFILKFKYFI